MLWLQQHHAQTKAMQQSPVVERKFVDIPQKNDIEGSFSDPYI